GGGRGGWVGRVRRERSCWPASPQPTRLSAILVAGVTEDGDAAAPDQPELDAWTSRVLHGGWSRRGHGGEHFIVLGERGRVPAPPVLHVLEPRVRLCLADPQRLHERGRGRPPHLATA